MGVELSRRKGTEAVLTGVSDRGALRGAFASLDTRQQILIMGHAVPMPVMMRTRQFDQSFYSAMGARVGIAHDTETGIRDLFGDQ